MNLREAAQQALEALEQFAETKLVRTSGVINALRTALAEPEQEPVAYVHVHRTGGNAGIAWSAIPTDNAPMMRDGEPLYAMRPSNESAYQRGYMDGMAKGRREQPSEPEPVAWMYEWDGRMHLTFTDQRFVEQAHPHFNKATPLYTAPQPIEQPKQEPVAWRYKFARGARWDFAESDPAEWRDLDVTAEPLYTHPSQRKPLTDEEIEDVIAEWWRDDLKMKYKELARAIERAHGIGGEA